MEGATAACLPFLQHLVHVQKLMEPFMNKKVIMENHRRNIQMEQHKQYQYLQRARKIQTEKYIQQSREVMQKTQFMQKIT